MAFGLSSFGFQTSGGGGGGTNTNLGNADLTADDTRTYEIDGNTLDFQHSGNSILRIEEDNVSFGTSQGISEINFRFGTNNPALQIYEASGSGNKLC